MKSKSKSLPRIDERQSLLRQSRNLKMAGSAHAYVRGNTLKFYEWLKAADSTLPQGPPIWICGDCHVGNLGPIASAHDEIGIQIRDLDQTVIGNPAHDLIRLRSRKNDARIEVLDAAYWVKGCSSLGRLRYAVLVGVGKDLSKEGALCLMDIKEAVQSAAPRHAKGRMPRDNAERIVQGARELSPAIGDRMLAARLLERGVFLRELRPQDLKLEIDQLTREEAMTAARYLAGVVGKAHARQMDAPTRQKWRDVLRRNRSTNLEAPTWLWSSVVELVASHEAAYLEHCRRYAIDPGVA